MEENTGGKIKQKQQSVLLHNLRFLKNRADSGFILAIHTSVRGENPIADAVERIISCIEPRIINALMKSPIDKFHRQLFFLEKIYKKY